MKLKPLTGRKETPKKEKPPIKKKQNKDRKEKYVNLLPFSLTAEISKKYEGFADSLGGFISDLPIDIKTLFTNSELKTATYRQGFALFILGNGFEIKFKDIKYGNNHSKLVTIKRGKRIVFNGYIKKLWNTQTTNKKP